MNLASLGEQEEKEEKKAKVNASFNSIKSGGSGNKKFVVENYQDVPLEARHIIEKIIVRQQQRSESRGRSENFDNSKLSTNQETTTIPSETHPHPNNDAKWRASLAERYHNDRQNNLANYHSHSIIYDRTRTDISNDHNTSVKRDSSLPKGDYLVKTEYKKPLPQSREFSLPKGEYLVKTEYKKPLPQSSNNSYNKSEYRSNDHLKTPDYKKTVVRKYSPIPSN